MAHAFDTKHLSLSGDVAPIAQGVLVNAPYSRAMLSLSDNGILAYGGAPSVAEPSRLRWLDRTGKQIGTVGDPGTYANPRLSPDGKKLAVVVGDASRAATDIWIYDLQHGDNTRLTFDASLNYSRSGPQMAAGLSLTPPVTTDSRSYSRRPQTARAAMSCCWLRTPPNFPTTGLQTGASFFMSRILR